MIDDLKTIKDLIAEGSYHEAKKMLIDCFSQGNENNAEMVKLMGLVNVNLNLFKDAKSDFEKVIKMAPKDATALFYLANCYDNLGDAVGAEKYYKQLLEIRENYVDAYKNLCIVYMKTGRELNAIELAQKGKEIAPNDYTFDYLIGTASITLKKYNQGIEYIRVQADPQEQIQ